MRFICFFLMLTTITAFGSADEMVRGVIRGDSLKVRELLGNAGIFESQEYRFVDKAAYRVKLPDRPQAIWFDPVQTDWSQYAALDFRFYNPGNEEVILKLMVQSGDDSEAKQLPDYISIPSGVISLPRETEVFKRLILNVSEFRNAVDLTKIKGIYLETRTEDTEIFLEGFRLLTVKELEEESTLQRQKKISTALERIQKLGDMPERLRAELEKAETELKAMGTSTEEADEHLALRKANELCTLAEAFAAKGVIRGESASAKLLANTEKVFRDLPISILPDAGILRLAGNERGGFQLLLIPGEKIGEYSMESGNLESEEGASIPASEITLNPVAYVEVLNSFIYPGSRPGWWPDPLLDNRPMLLDQKVQPVWVTIRVPENQPKGRYSGKLVVRNEARE